MRSPRGDALKSFTSQCWRECASLIIQDEVAKDGLVDVDHEPARVGRAIVVYMARLLAAVDHPACQTPMSPGRATAREGVSYLIE